VIYPKVLYLLIIIEVFLSLVLSTICVSKPILFVYKEGSHNMYILEDQSNKFRVSFFKDETNIWHVSFDIKLGDNWRSVATYKDNKPWRVYSRWENGWFAEEHSFNIEEIYQLDKNHIKAVGKGKVNSHDWVFEDLYSIEGGLIKVERKWVHKDEKRQPYITLENSIQVSLDLNKDLRVMMPGIIYNDNPSALPERIIPHFPYKKGSLSLYEEHRFPIPFVHAEYILEDRRLYFSLLTIPSEVPFGHKEDQWWSLGGKLEQDKMLFLSLSGPVASNGRKSVVYGHQNNFDHYDEVYLDIPGKVNISKTFFIDMGETERVGYAFRNTVYKAYKIFKPRVGRKLSLEEKLNLKLSYAKSLYVDINGACGFLFDSDISRPVFGYGWVGQNLALAYSILTFSLEDKDKAWIEKAIRAVDFYLENSKTKIPGLRFVEYNIWTQSWSGDWNSNIISARQYGETLDSLADLIFLGKKYSLDVSKWQKALEEAGNFLIRTPRFNGLFPRYWKSDGDPLGWGKGITDKDLSTAGVYLISPLAKLYLLTGDIKYLEVAETSLRAYWEYNSKDLSKPYWGATLDAGCEDKESGAGFLHACLAVYEATKKQEYLEWAKDAADWLLTFVYFYDTGFRKGTPCYKRINTIGWTSVSVQNHHLDVWGNFIVPDLLMLSNFTKEEFYKEIAVMMFDATSQGIATQEYMWGYEREGDQSEQFYQTNYYQDGTQADWRGGFSHWHPAWIVASTLVAGIKLFNLGAK
jgi:hypothetical protein